MRKPKLSESTELGGSKTIQLQFVLQVQSRSDYFPRAEQPQGRLVEEHWHWSIYFLASWLLFPKVAKP